MRLITRADFDGLCCAALLKDAEMIDSFLYVHPKDVQDGKVEVGANDILANVPFVEGAGMWFDHHVSEAARLRQQAHAFKGLKGAVRKAPSAARVIWDYYGGTSKFSDRFEDMLDAVDKVDSADLTIEEITNPEGWILVGLLMDPRTGIGRHKLSIDHWDFLKNMVDIAGSASVDEVLANADVKERVELYFEEVPKFQEMLKAHTEDHGKVVVTDLRMVEAIHVGNRFLIYALYPECRVSMQVMYSKTVDKVVVTAGHSIVNTGSGANIGRIMLEYGGGGHAAVGTCQVETGRAEIVIAEIVDRILDED